MQTLAVLGFAAPEHPSGLSKAELKPKPRPNPARTATANPEPMTPLSEVQAADAELALRVADALARALWVPDSVVSSVEAGWVTLSGSVARQYQRNAARKAAAAVEGAHGVTNDVTVQLNRVAEAVHAQLKHDREVNASAIHVEVVDGTATLTGAVLSRGEREAAAWAAWRAPGVKHVLNHLVVRADPTAGS